MRQHVANARMYAVTPDAAAAWAALFRHVAGVSGVRLTVVEHPFPAPVGDLWRRDDLALAFMCGWPWARSGARHVAVAAPVPAGNGRPVYWSDLVVRAEDPRGLEQMAGARLGYTLLESQSGFSALRHYLLERGSPAFGAVVGPLTTPRRMIEAVVDGRVDVGPVDSFAHALLRRHLPELTVRVRVAATTAPTPVPLLVASPGAEPGMVRRLRDALLELRDPALLESLALEGFAEPLPREAYMAMEERALEAERAGVHDLRPFLAARAA